MNENPKYVVIPWELAVSLDETLDMDLRMASIYDGDDIDGSGIDYGNEAEGILEDRKALRKAMAKAMEDELTPDLFNKNAIVWNKYPENKPKLWTRKLVTFINDSGQKEVGFDSLIENGGKEVWGLPGFPLKVIAWAEQPEPYKEPEPLDMHQDAVTARKYSEGDPETVKALNIFAENKE